MRILGTSLLVCALAGPVAAGELDLDLGAQATTTAWPDDHGGGFALDAGWWFKPWLGASFIGKEQYAKVDDRFMSYFSVNVAGRQPLGPLRATATLGLVHQHEEPRAVVMEEPLLSIVGTADGIRHRFAGRAGVQLALPVRDTAHGDMYIALDLDGTRFTDTDKGPAWMANVGLSFGFTYDFARKPK
jgi:hypothetical protein